MRKQILIAVILVAALLITAGCANGGGAPGYNGEQAQDGNAGWDNGNGSQPEDAPITDISPDYGGHKVIRSADMTIETRIFEEDIAHIKQKAAELGGYVASSNISGKVPSSYGDSGRNAQISLRIPQERLEPFMADVRGMAAVIYESLGSEDVTKQYYDSESRLKMYETKRDRLLALLEVAEDLDAIIKLETELNQVNYQIESITSQLKQWDDLIKFSSITITVREQPNASLSSGPDSFGQRISDGLAATLSGMGVFFENLLAFLIIASPVILLLAVIALAVILIFRRRRGKARVKAKKSERDGNTPPNEE